MSEFTQAEVMHVLKAAKFLSVKELISYEKLIGVYGPMTSVDALQAAINADNILAMAKSCKEYYEFERDNYLTYAAILEKLENAK